MIGLAEIGTKYKFNFLLLKGGDREREWGMGRTHHIPPQKTSKYVIIKMQ
jgi:hypothetical protein